jgi:predicted phosphodiesterase
MPTALISDVHANREALVSVLKDIKQRKFSSILFLGDAVGYGPEPNECIELLGSECGSQLAGNHDWGTCGLTDISFFNVYARTAIEWTKTVIDEKNSVALRSFPVVSERVEEQVTLAHASPYEPEQWHYVMTLSDAELNFRYFSTHLCFIGHSHIPFVIEKLPHH